jgi:hypothetical protein
MKVIATVLLALGSVIALPLNAPAATNVIRVTPHTVSFGVKPVGSFTIKTSTVTNTSSETIYVSIDVTRDWDNFSTLIDSTCGFLDPQPLAAGESCTVVVGFRPSEFFVGLKQDQRLLVTATDPQSGAVLDSVELLFLGRARRG